MEPAHYMVFPFVLYMSRSYLYVMVLFYRLKCSQIHKNGPQDSNVSATSSLDQLSELNKKVIHVG